MRIAIVGATGLVGQTLLTWLDKLDVPVGSLSLFGTHSQNNRTRTFKGQAWPVQTLQPGCFDGVDLVFFSAGKAVSETYVPQALKAGCWVIDNTSAFRYDPSVPLVVPQVNGHTITSNNRLIANPNCSTIQLLVALKPIYDAVGVRSMDVVTYQSISGAGRQATDAMRAQTAQLLSTHDDNDSSRASPRQGTHPDYAFNVIPWIDEEEAGGYCREEMKIIWETHKILHDNRLMINPTVARVPVFRGHSAAVHLITEKPITPEQAKQLWQATRGINTTENCPTPRSQAAGHPDVWVGRIRQHLNTPLGLNFWCVSDNLIRGAAYNAVQIACLIQKVLNKQVC